MAEELGTGLNQFAGLLARIADQNDARQEHYEELQKRLEEFRNKESRFLPATHRRDGFELWQRLLTELERHNRLPEPLIERFGNARKS